MPLRRNHVGQLSLVPMAQRRENHCLYLPLVMHVHQELQEVDLIALFNRWDCLGHATATMKASHAWLTLRVVVVLLWVRLAAGPLLQNMLVGHKDLT